MELEYEIEADRDQQFEVGKTAGTEDECFCRKQEAIGRRVISPPG